MFASLDKADIQQLGQNLNALVVNLNKKLDEVPVAQLSAEAMAVLKDARATIDRVDRDARPGPDRPDGAQPRIRLGAGSTICSPTRR